MEFEDNMLLENDKVFKNMNETSNFIETNDYTNLTKSPQSKNSNGNKITMNLNQVENSISKGTLHDGEHLFTLNQSHDSICENYKSFHNLGMNIEIFKTLNGPDELKKSIEDNDALSSKLNATLDTSCLSKSNIEHIENNIGIVDLKAREQDQSLTNLESMITDQIHLGCTNQNESMNPLENISSINSKQNLEENDDAMKKDPITQKQSKFDKKDKIKGHRSSQRLLHEAMTKKLLEANTNGLRPCRMTTNCNSLPQLKKNSKEDDVKTSGKYYVHILFNTCN